MSGEGDNGTRHSKITWEERHWIEYGVFAFVLITAMATATTAGIRASNGKYGG